jgi:alpha-1,2-mannosyltransferase
MSTSKIGRPARAGLWVVAVVVAVAQAWAGLSRPIGDRLADLQVYLGSVTELRGGGSLYDFAAAGTGAPFTYPPFAGLVFLPLALVPFALVAVAWSVATFGVVLLLARAVARQPEGRTHPVALVALVLFASAPISSNFRFGQISVFLVLAVLVDALDVVPARWRGIATGVAAAIKLTPLIFVPYLWFAGRRRAALTATGTFLAGTALAGLLLPGESLRFWFTEVWNVNRVGHLTTTGNQALNGALLRWGVDDHSRTLLVAVVGGVVVVLALVRAVRAHRNGSPLSAVVIVGAAGLVFSPVSWTHHQVWLVLAALAAVSARPSRNVCWQVGVVAVMVLPVTGLLAGTPLAPVTGNARLWLAIAIAAVIPFVAVRTPAAPAPALPVQASVIPTPARSTGPAAEGGPLSPLGPSVAPSEAGPAHRGGLAGPG